MTIRSRLERLEHTGGYAGCPDPCHRPPAPGRVRHIDYRDGLAALAPPGADLTGLAATDPDCPTCGEPPAGFRIVAIDWAERGPMAGRAASGHASTDDAG